ncbi:hypothetical protein ACH3XW_15195 [Acanthocheilonema viteae]
MNVFLSQLPSKRIFHLMPSERQFFRILYCLCMAHCYKELYRKVLILMDFNFQNFPNYIREGKLMPICFFTFFKTKQKQSVDDEGKSLLISTEKRSIKQQLLILIFVLAFTAVTKLRHHFTSKEKS